MNFYLLVFNITIYELKFFMEHVVNELVVWIAVTTSESHGGGGGGMSL
jgi:hypothetical protein